jgi:glycosyltransferase involved in cell wall biosynthesis
MPRHSIVVNELDERQPMVSLIVPTYNREEVLCRTLGHLFEQDYPNYEIVVVDQTVQHTSETEQFMARNSERLRHIKLERPSLTRARNAGILHARGAIVLFLDDDIVPVKSLVSAHVAALLEPGTGAVGAVAGQVLPPDGRRVDTENVGTIEHRSNIVANFNSTIAGPAVHAPGGNTAVWRHLAIEAGMFEPRFAGTAIREETDFYLRLVEMGYGIKFEPRASILHLALTAGGCGNRRSDMRWYFWFAHNNTLLALRHPSLLSARRVILSQWPLFRRKKGILLLAPWLVAHLYALVSYVRALRSLRSARAHARQQPDARLASDYDRQKPQVSSNQ